jgi:hypothetical protein
MKELKTLKKKRSEPGWNSLTVLHNATFCVPEANVPVLPALLHILGAFLFLQHLRVSGGRLVATGGCSVFPSSQHLAFGWRVSNFILNRRMQSELSLRWVGKTNLWRTLVLLLSEL